MKTQRIYGSGYGLTSSVRTRIISLTRLDHLGNADSEIKDGALGVIVEGPSNYQNSTAISPEDAAKFLKGDEPSQLEGNMITAYYFGTRLGGVQRWKK